MKRSSFSSQMKALLTASTHSCLSVGSVTACPRALPRISGWAGLDHSGRCVFACTASVPCLSSNWKSFKKSTCQNLTFSHSAAGVFPKAYKESRVFTLLCFGVENCSEMESYQPNILCEWSQRLMKLEGGCFISVFSFDFDIFLLFWFLVSRVFCS